MSVTATAATKVPVVMVWSFEEGGFHYVGPFGSVTGANKWGAENEDTHGLEWHTEVIDLAVPLEVRAPDGVANLPDHPDDGAPLLPTDVFQDSYSDTPGAAFHLLMTDADPLHLVGPFGDHRTAFFWGVRNERRGGCLGWQCVWIEDPTAPARLVPAVSASA